MKKIIFLFCLTLFLVSCQKDKVNDRLPVVSIDPSPIVILNTSVKLFITVVYTFDGHIGAQIRDCGVCWSTNPNPTMNDNKLQFDTGLCVITGLKTKTTYFIRGYAVNNVGTIYSDQLTITTL